MKHLRQIDAGGMRFLSVCSGIEAASVAWNPLGWKAEAFAEIEPFPCSILSHHYPETPNLGDMTKYHEWNIGPIDLLCGGTPCQSFSVAGLRKGLADPRGNLALVFLGIVDRFRPKWVVWENVPGVLSSEEGRDFACFLGGLGQLGYGWAYRVLDAQYFGVPQRRRRPFIVGYLGDWRRPAAVLFERHCLQGHPAPCRQAGKNVAPTISARTKGSGGLGTDFDCDGGLIAAHTLLGKPNCSHDTTLETYIAHSLTGNGFDASEDGTGRGTPLVPIAFSAKDYGAAVGEVAPTLRAGGHAESHQNGGVMPAVAIPLLEIGKGTSSRGSGPNGCGIGNNGDPMFTLQAGAQHGIGTQWGVRRLTPTECERLQGFPDGYTLVPHRGKPAKDGPRYKALGNSWAVPCARWIGRRIELVESLTRPQTPQVEG
jgi:DNA (cytosine-5)-methyltransferase 1